MRQLNTYDTSRMKAVAAETFNDTCSIHTPTITTISLGKQSKTWSSVDNVSCGFNPSNATKTYRGEVISFDWDAVMRLPISTSIDSKKEITCRGNRYRVHGITEGITVNIITLKRVDSNE